MSEYCTVRAERDREVAALSNSMEESGAGVPPMSRRWYAIEHRYGAHVQDNDGDHLGEVFAFPTKAAREEWVAGGPAYFDQPGARVALEFSDRRDRIAIRRFKTER